MAFFKLSTNIHILSNLTDFITAFAPGKNDLILTNRFLHSAHMNGIESNYLFQDDYGPGEPTDVMIQQMIETVKSHDFNRIIAIGGGSIIDIAKVLSIKNITNVTDAFERKMPIEKGPRLVVIPTTCGTGSEVTNITIAEMTSLGMKMGLAHDALVPDDAVLIAQMLHSLPFEHYMYSAIDALIHAMESYVSPKANFITQMYSEKAIEWILETFKTLDIRGTSFRSSNYDQMLLASTFAGIAFGNAGVGAVHALSYPVGGTFHVAHGEANYQFLTAVFNVYTKIRPQGSIASLNEKLSNLLNVPTNEVYTSLDQLLSRLVPNKQLSHYGMTDSQIAEFTNKVVTGQQRLLANNYVTLTEKDIYDIYASRL